MTPYFQPNVSRHLAYLHRAGLVTVRQQGKWKYYTFPKRPIGLRRALLNCVRACRREIDILHKDLFWPKAAITRT